MATIPLSGTNIRLLSGIPFSNDYKHTRWFDSSTEQTAYFLGKTPVHEMTRASFQRQDNKTFIAVNKRIDSLYGVNYVMFQNEDYSTKWFYGFVTRLEYKNDATTYVHVQLDLFQTWKNRIQFQPSFVVREHRPLWQSDGRPVVNTIDEGLEYGLEYDTVSVERIQPSDGIQFLVIISKTPMHVGNDGNDIKPVRIGMPQPLTYYVVPYDTKNPTVVVADGEGDSSVINDPTTVMKDLYANEKAVNNIVSMYITDHIGKAITITRTQGQPTVIKGLYPDSFPNVTIGDNTNCLYVKSLSNFTTDLIPVSDNKYADFVPVTESKLLMYPYTNIVLDDFKGNRTAYKVEYINGNHLGLMVKGSLGLSNYVSYGIDNYNHGNVMDNPEFGALNNESALISNVPNDVTVINDYLSAFLQGNRNQIENQENSILFNGVMNGIQAGVSGAGSAMERNPFGVAQAVGQVAQGAGNTVLELQGIEAKQKDIANIPPTIQKMGSNTAYSMGHGFNGVYLIKKQIKAEYRRKLQAFFNMYGYKTNEVKVPNFHTRRYWNYVQTKGCVILGDFNADDLVELKAIFDNGITLWHTDQVGNYELANEVL